MFIGEIGERLRRLDERVLGAPRPGGSIVHLGASLTAIGGLNVVAGLLGSPGALLAGAFGLVAGAPLLVLGLRDERRRAAVGAGSSRARGSGPPEPT